MIPVQPARGRSRFARRFAAANGALPGLVTLAAGSHLLPGADPGDVAYRPLLVYSTAMGAACLAVGLAIWRSPRTGAAAAGAVALLNLLVLAGISMLVLRGAPVAVDSLRAMAFQTIVWLVVLGFAVRSSGRRRPA